jgi:hypothetical protein
MFRQMITCFRACRWVVVIAADVFVVGLRLDAGLAGCKACKPQARECRQDRTEHAARVSFQAFVNLHQEHHPYAGHGYLELSSESAGWKRP